MRCKSHFEVLGGPLYQWDTGRQLRIAPQDGETVIEAHFARPTNDKAVVVSKVVFHGPGYAYFVKK